MRWTGAGGALLVEVVVVVGNGDGGCICDGRGDVMGHGGFGGPVKVFSESVCVEPSVVVSNVVVGVSVWALIDIVGVLGIVWVLESVVFALFASSLAFIALTNLSVPSFAALNPSS